MVEVKGKNKKSVGILTFDGNVLEIFGFAHKHASRRIHVDQIVGLIKENNGLTIGFGEGIISIFYTEGCENIDELINAIISASNNHDLIVK
ncbi:MAG: hypothetical protein HZC47_06635 [Methanobacterium sp.]|uniref:hypothetical protein n=1 Tax=Methanobacterium sp. TaxID=2164 RepID=UPI003D65C430|nr:hypothetical protein [Methanobacterium sp.]